MAIPEKHIDKIFNRKFSLLDQKEFVNFLSDEQLNNKVKLVVEKQWNQFEPGKEDALSLDHVFYKLHYTINNLNEPSIRIKSLFFRISQIAAILIAAILIAASIYFSFGRSSSEQSIEFISQTGFRNQFKLPDGTSGWLGYGSQIKYHIDKRDRRVVDLDGLAYFDVAHKERQSFIVNTPSKLNIEVLGTRFNVSSYSNDHFCEIVLEHGKVKLSKNDQEVEEMHPNERIVYRASDNTIEKSNVNVSDFVAWKDGKLILQDVSLEETCKKLGRYFNVDFVLQADMSSDQKVRLVLENESLDDALKLLALIVPINCQVEERKILEDNSYSRKKIIIKNK